MKKIVIFIICLNILSLPVFSTELIRDDFAEKTLSKNLKIPNACDKEIKDEFVSKTLDPKQHQIIYVRNKNIQDSFTQRTLLNYKPPETRKRNVNFDFESDVRLPLRIKICEHLTTKRKIKEGQDIYFEVAEDTQIKSNFILKKGTKIKARVETISMNDIWGVPADVIIENFKLKENPNALKIEGHIHKVGANRSIWVYPLVYAGAIFFYAGLAAIPIRGGHAKIKPHEVYEIYYNPNI